MMWYILFWALPGIVAFFIFIYIMEKRITINDIISVFIIGSIFGPVSVVFTVLAICAEYGDIVVFPFKKER